MHTHTSATQPGKCVLLFLFFFPLSPIECFPAYFSIYEKWSIPGKMWNVSINVACQIYTPKPLTFMWMIQNSREMPIWVSLPAEVRFIEVWMFFSPILCVIGCSVEAYPRWTYHSYAVKTSAAHSSSEKWFWVRLKKKKQKSSCTLATSFLDSLDFQPTITCRKMWMFLTSFPFSFSPLRRIELLYGTAVI